MSARRPKNVSRARWREIRGQAEKLATLGADYFRMIANGASQDVLDHAISEMVDIAGPAGFHPLMCSLVTAAGEMVHLAHGCDGNCKAQPSFAIITDTADGIRKLEPEQAPPAMVALGRYITAALANDDETALAVWRSVPPAQEHFGPFIVALHKWIASQVRLAAAATGEAR